MAAVATEASSSTEKRPSTHKTTERTTVQVMKVWQELLEREGWGRIPHYALGGSSGAAFVLFLGQRIPLDGVAPVIMAVPPQTLEVKPRSADSAKSWNFPPTFFVHMARDEMTVEGVTADVATLKKQVPHFLCHLSPGIKAWQQPLLNHSLCYVILFYVTVVALKTQVMPRMMRPVLRGLH